MLIAAVLAIRIVVRIAVKVVRASIVLRQLVQIRWNKSLNPYQQLYTSQPGCLGLEEDLLALLLLFLPVD